MSGEEFEIDIEIENPDDLIESEEESVHTPESFRSMVSSLPSSTTPRTSTRNVLTKEDLILTPFKQFIGKQEKFSESPKFVRSVKEIKREFENKKKKELEIKQKYKEKLGRIQKKEKELKDELNLHLSTKRGEFHQHMMLAQNIKTELKQLYQRQRITTGDELIFFQVEMDYITNMVKALLKKYLETDVLDDDLITTDQKQEGLANLFSTCSFNLPQQQQINKITNWIERWKREKCVPLGGRNKELNITEYTKLFQNFVSEHQPDVPKEDIVASSRESQQVFVERSERTQFINQLVNMFRTFYNISDNNLEHTITSVLEKDGVDKLIHKVETVYNKKKKNKNKFKKDLNKLFSKYYDLSSKNNIKSLKDTFYIGSVDVLTKSELLDKIMQKVEMFYDATIHDDGVSTLNLEQLEQLFLPEDIQKISKNTVVYNDLRNFFIEYIIHTQLVGFSVLSKKQINQLRDLVDTQDDESLEEYFSNLIPNQILTKYENEHAYDLDTTQFGDITISKTSYPSTVTFNVAGYPINDNKSRIEYWVPKIHFVTKHPVFSEKEEILKIVNEGRCMYLKLHSFVEPNSGETVLYFRKYIDFNDFLMSWAKTFSERHNPGDIQRVHDIRNYFEDRKDHEDLEDYKINTYLQQLNEILKNN